MPVKKFGWISFGLIIVADNSPVHRFNTDSNWIPLAWLIHTILKSSIARGVVLSSDINIFLPISILSFSWSNSPVWYLPWQYKSNVWDHVFWLNSKNIDVRNSLFLIKFILTPYCFISFSHRSGTTHRLWPSSQNHVHGHNRCCTWDDPSHSWPRSSSLFSHHSNLILQWH